MLRITILFIAVALLLSGCLPDEPSFEAFRKSQIQILLADQGQKTWTLDTRTLNNEQIVLDECTPQRQIIFRYTVATKDKDSVFYVNYPDSCSIKADTLKGFWFVAGPLNAFETTDSLVIVWKNIDSTYFKINSLTPVNLSFETYFTDSLKESFTIQEIDSL